MKKFINKDEYVTPEMTVTVVDEDIITNSILGTDIEMPEVPAETTKNP